MKKLFALIALVLVVIVAGCVGSNTKTSNDNTTTKTEGSGTLAVAMKDKPINGQEVSAITLTISSIQIHQSSEVSASGNVTSNSTTNETDVLNASWKTVFSGSKTINLLEYTGDAALLFGNTTLSAGHYQQVRLYVDSATITTGNNTIALSVPSHVIKIVKGFDVESNKTTLLTLDWDTDTSIKQEGNGNYKMSPVIKITEEHGVDLSTKTNLKTDLNILNGSVKGSVSANVSLGV